MLLTRSPLATRCKHPCCRSTCMCKAFRQRSIWARIKLFSLIPNYYFFLLRGGISFRFILKFIYRYVYFITKAHGHTCHKFKCKHLYFLSTELDSKQLNKFNCNQVSCLFHKHPHLSVVILLKSFFLLPPSRFALTRCALYRVFKLRQPY